MRGFRLRFIGAAMVLCLVLICPSLSPGQALKERNEILLKQIQEVHRLSDQQAETIRTIFRESGFIGQGNPAIAEHPVREET